MTSVRRMTIADLATDPGLVRRLIDEGETLFVERKERDPKDGLGATIASFANMLGGWLLIGVDDSGKVVGYRPPGRVDLQDYIRQLLGAQVDPLPPFAAVRVRAGRHMIGVVHVAESSDTPHITRDGVIYVRNPGGKQRVTDHRDVLEMARRGERARYEAERVRLHLPLIEQAMTTPTGIFAGQQRFTLEDHAPPLIEWIVRASPYTVAGAFPDRALSAVAAELARTNVRSLYAPLPEPAVHVEARARGLYCQGAQMGGRRHADLAVDAGGAVAVRTAWRSRRGTLVLKDLPADVLCALIRAAADVLAGLDGYGRAAIGLEIRHAEELTMSWDSDTGRVPPESLIDGTRLEMGGDLAIPAAAEDITEVADRWVRELARAAQLPLWEPAP
jgi:hypothetical protein